MHLQGDKAFRQGGIYQVSGGYPVYPCTDLRSSAFYPVFVPLRLFEGVLSARVQFHRVLPAAAPFFVYTSAPAPVRRVYFHLVAKHTAVLVISPALAPELNAGIERFIQLKFQLQYKIAIIFFSCQEGVGCLQYSRSHNFIVLYTVFRCTSQLLPSFQVFAVKQWRPLALFTRCSGACNAM